MCICSKWDTERASQTEIGKFQVSFRVDEKVLRFEISVKDSTRVAVV